MACFEMQVNGHETRAEGDYIRGVLSYLLQYIEFVRYLKHDVFCNAGDFFLWQQFYCCCQSELNKNRDPLSILCAGVADMNHPTVATAHTGELRNGGVATGNRIRTEGRTIENEVHGKSSCWRAPGAVSASEF